MFDFDYNGISNIGTFIERLRELDKVAILGNGVSMLDVDFKALDSIFTIGVNHIEQLYTPNTLLWVDNSYYRIKDVYYGHSPLKLCRSDSYGRNNAITFYAPNRVSYGHRWRGQIPRTGSYLSAIYISMLCVKTIYLVGCDFAENAHFYDYLKTEKAKQVSETNHYIRRQLGRNFSDERKSILSEFRILAKNNKECNIYFTARNCWKEFLNVFPFKDVFNVKV